jgi:integrase
LAKSQDKEFEHAKQERAALQQQNRELLCKMHSQSALIASQKEQIQQLIDELNQRLEKDKIIQDKRAKRNAAKKQPSRDAITPEEFQLIIHLFLLLKLHELNSLLVYLTGLRVSNLLGFSVLNLQELMQQQSTLIHIIKGGSKIKIIIATDAKFWCQLVQTDI